jgi:cytochrome c-type biogenesis protein CcmH
MTRWLRRSALALLLLLFASAPALADAEHGNLERSAATADLFDYVAGAQVLEGQLLAPCCWNQTLDIHGSETSNGLRREIRERLRSGQTVDAIRDDIITRYGNRILAVPPSSPLKNLAIVLSMIFGAAGFGAVVLLRRWRRRNEDEQAKGKHGAKPNAQRDEWDDRLESELDQLEK